MLYPCRKFFLLFLKIGSLFCFLQCSSLPSKQISKLVPGRYHAKASLHHKVKKSRFIYTNSIIESQEFSTLLARLEAVSTNKHSDDGAEKYSNDEFEDEFGEEETEIYDPWETMNRTFFSFNDFVFIYGLNPIAQANAFLLPRSLRGGIDNFFKNLGMPVRMFSALLQGKILKASVEISNFIINSTLGVGGLFQCLPRLVWYLRK